MSVLVFCPFLKDTHLDWIVSLLVSGIYLLFIYLGLHLWQMEVPRLGVKLELQLPAYAIATATPDLSLICNLHHSLWQCWILNPLSGAGDWTLILTDIVSFCFCFCFFFFLPSLQHAEVPCAPAATPACPLPPLPKQNSSVSFYNLCLLKEFVHFIQIIKFGITIVLA